MNILKLQLCNYVIIKLSVNEQCSKSNNDKLIKNITEIKKEWAGKRIK